MPPGKPFSLYRRKKIFYARFKLPSGGWTTARSTGKTTKGAAESWCINYLKDGPIIANENITFDAFTRGFFDFNGPWVKDRRAAGRRISENHCQQRNDLVKNHLAPAFGSKKLTAITRGDIKAFRNGMIEAGYSGTTVNHCLSTLKAILEYAEEAGLLRDVPRIDRAAVNHKHRGILTIDEAKRLFAVEWIDKRGRAGNLIAACTGMRLGELQALTLGDIRPEGYITVSRAWDRQTRKVNPTTKTGRERNVFIPGLVRREISSLLEYHPDPAKKDSFLFFSLTSPHKPTEETTFTRSLYRALEDIGIDDATRKERYITFHSWRHWFNSLLVNAKVPLQKVQALTGHSTLEMSQHYYHVDEMADVVQVVEGVLA